eukprot:gene10784-11938_t
MGSSTAFTLTLFYAVSIVAGTTTNVLIIIVILRRKELRRRRANHFLASLCLSDLMTCAYSMTYHLVHLHPAIYTHFLSTTYCKVTQYFVYTLAFSSTLCLTMACIDRYIAILHPFYYATVSMARLSSLLMVWPWLLSLTTALPAVVTDMITTGLTFGFPCAAVSNKTAQNYLFAIAPINIILPFIGIIITCSMVFRVARKQQRKVQTQMVFVRNRDALSTFDSTVDQVSGEERTSTMFSGHWNTQSENSELPRRTTRMKIALKNRFKMVFREESRIAFATIVVVIGFFIAWTPFVVTRMLYAVGCRLSNDVYMFGTVFVLFHSAWNPLLLLIVRKDLWRSLYRLLKPKCV